MNYDRPSQSGVQLDAPYSPPLDRNANIRYAYLAEQFEDPTEILDSIKRVVDRGDFTLGEVVEEFEGRFADALNMKHAVGVASGTDAIKLSLRAMGVGAGDEVITAANTFVATVGAIHELGARPVLVDCDDSFCIDVGQVEGRITKSTKAIVPVQLTGNMADMKRLTEIAERRGITVVEDACQAFLAEIDGRPAGSWGAAGAFSLHPLKNLNVWGDGGMIVTNNDSVAQTLRLLRNHGLKNRDEIVMLGHNSRLDSIQAVVGLWLIDQVEELTGQRIANARYYDGQLVGIPQIQIPVRSKNIRQVFHLYVVFAKYRDELYDYCRERGIGVKIHYPVPLYQQEGLRFLGYRAGQFPMTDRHAATSLTLPVDQHLNSDQLDIVVDTIREFYAGR